MQAVKGDLLGTALVWNLVDSGVAQIFPPNPDRHYRAVAQRASVGYINDVGPVPRRNDYPPSITQWQ
jgi:hypothetical protein